MTTKYKSGDIIELSDSNHPDMHRIYKVDKELLYGINITVSNGRAWILVGKDISPDYAIVYRKILTKLPRREVIKHSRFKIL